MLEASVIFSALVAPLTGLFAVRVGWSQLAQHRRAEGRVSLIRQPCAVPKAEVVT